jgi:hypothetical protein
MAVFYWPVHDNNWPKWGKLNSLLIYSVWFFNRMGGGVGEDLRWISDGLNIDTRNKRTAGDALKTYLPGDSEPTPTNAPSTGCSLLLSCGWTSTELIFGFTLATNYLGK